jgi:hypothetical protein
VSDKDKNPKYREVHQGYNNMLLVTGFTVKVVISSTGQFGKLSINQKLTKRPIRFNCSLDWQHPAPILRVQAGAGDSMASGIMVT